ncbi:MAG: EAL domain-containing protein [Pseudomonadota bacterium]
MQLRYLLIIVFFFLALSPVLLFRAWPHSVLMERELKEVEETHLLLAENVAASLQRYAEDVETTVKFLGDNLQLWGASPRLLDIMRPLGIRKLCLFDRRSGEVTESLILGGLPCPSVVLAASFGLDADSLESGEFRYSAVKMAPDGNNVFRFGLKLSDDILLLGSLSTEVVHELGAAIAFGERGHAAIVDQDGNVLSHPLPDWVRERRNISEISAVQRMLSGQSGVTLFRSPALGADMVAGFAPVNGPGWGVMIPQPLEELESKVAEAQESTLYVLLIGVGSALLLALLGSMVAVRPLEELTKTAKRVSLGDLALPPSMAYRAFQSREFRELHDGIRNMVLRLRKNQERINKLAFFDTVTGLANRECFRRRVQAFLDDGSAGNQGSLLFIDLDGFKAVNDTMGHDAGDDVLGQVGARLSLLLGGEALTPRHPILKDYKSAGSVARLGGDEFAIFLPHADAKAALNFAEDVRQKIEVPFPYDESILSLGASIGVARLPEDATDYSGLLKAADIAMYEAKRGGKNRACVYSASPPIRRERRHNMAEDLFSSEISDQIEMHYQPVYRATDMRVASAEGLIRWQHPKYGLLTPQSFFKMVAQLGLQRQIDKLAFEQTIDAMRDLAARNLSPKRLSLNIPVERLLDTAFVDHVLEVLPLPFRLSFELVEATYSDASVDQAYWAVDRLREAGVEFELDDFGSAEASLTAMLNLAPHRIKIDPRLTSGVADSPGIAAMISGLVRTAHALEIDVVAKGLETHEQVGCLRRLGVDYLQGFVLKKPLDAQDLAATLRDRLVTPTTDGRVKNQISAVESRYS